MVLPSGEQMESRFGFLGKSPGPVLTCGDFEVQVLKITALVFVLDPQIGNRNLVLHKVQIIFIGNADALVCGVLTRVDLREFFVQLLFEFVVENDAAKLAAGGFDFLGHLVVQAIDFGVVTDFFGFNEAVIDRLAVGNPVLASEELVGVACERKDIL